MLLNPGQLVHKDVEVEKQSVMKMPLLPLCRYTISSK